MQFLHMGQIGDENVNLTGGGIVEEFKLYKHFMALILAKENLARPIVS